jgi:glutamate carboxypeptidase
VGDGTSPVILSELFLKQELPADMLASNLESGSVASLRMTAGYLPTSMRSLILSVLLAASASAQTLTAPERAIARAVDTHNAEALTLLERVVNINSGTNNAAGVRAVGEIFVKELQALGFNAQLVQGSRDRGPHLVADHAGPGPKVLLIGHLDTVFEPTSPFQKFEKLNDSTATGPGVIDMKGGDVIIVHALKALKDAGQLDRMNIVVVMTGDEESAGRPLAEARRALVNAAQGSAYALGFEDGPGDPKYAVISRRSSTSWRLTTTGATGHSSQIFGDQMGFGAIYEAARIVNAFRETLSKEQYLTFNPGMAVGGTETTVDATATSGTAAGKTNVIPPAMTVTGDIRAISPEQLSNAQVTMRRIVSQNLPKTTATISFDEGYPPMAPTDGNRRLLAQYDAASRGLGLPPVAAVDPSRAGAADVAFVASTVPMLIDGIGLMGHDDHSDKETADLRTLPTQTKKAAILIARLGAGVRP